MLGAIFPTPHVIMATTNSLLAIPEPTFIITVIVIGSLLLVLGLAVLYVNGTFSVGISGVNLNLKGFQKTA